MTAELLRLGTESGLADLPPRADREVEFHVGIDDTDSRLGGCTTYTAAIVFEELCMRGFTPSDFPWLVRLNPNIPWKTRGNGALAVHFKSEEYRLDEAMQVVVDIVDRTSDPSIPSTDPAVVFLAGGIPPTLREFSRRALYDVIKVADATKLAQKNSIQIRTFGGKRGVIGGLAAVGYDMATDHTFELIAYRTAKNCGTPRRVDLDSVRKMNSRYAGKTFNNLDPETGRVLICPHGPDPVLLGIRGEDPSALSQAFSEIVVREPVERIMVFMTNHGTDAHLTRHRNAAEVRPAESAVITGVVETDPVILLGGHVFLRLEDETGFVVCAAYEPTGALRKVVRELIPGDLLRVSGGVRLGPAHEITLNLEKVEVLQLAEKIELKKPRCSDCRSSCEAMGRGQGFRCRGCGLRFSRDSVKRTTKARAVNLGTYIPPPRAQRHLTRPVSRYYGAMTISSGGEQGC